MPRRSPLSPTKDAFFPANDHATHRDLLLFEERLKTNALLLNRRKSRYQCALCPISRWMYVFLAHLSSVFLFQLIGTIVFLLSEVLLQTSFLSILSRFLLRHALPEHYGPDDDFRVHPYFVSGLLFVAVTTLVLFFASGMYSEKIGYANRCVCDVGPPLHCLTLHQLRSTCESSTAELQHVPQHARSPTCFHAQPTVLSPCAPRTFFLGDTVVSSYAVAHSSGEALLVRYPHPLHSPFQQPARRTHILLKS